LPNTWADERSGGVFFDALDPSRVYVGIGGNGLPEDKGVFESKDTGLTWTRMDHTGFYNTMVVCMTQAHVDGRKAVYAGTLGGGVFRREFEITTQVSEKMQIPKTVQLLQNYPNPFNPTTTIEFGIPTGGHVSLTIYNTIGQTISELLNNEVREGYHKVSFDASRLASGIYFYRLEVGGVALTKKMLLMK
jgi:hypothetical protein